MYKKFVKRLLDIIFALIGLTVLSPVFVILIILVRTKLGSPVFFHQDRPGLNQKIFRLWKFRTMTDERDAGGKLLPDEERLTKFGLLLRKTSLDEIPELVNILKGDMSFIGPRPLLPEYLPWYTPREQLRHTVRPGLTGLAQASGRNFISWDKRFELDVYYVEHLTFAMDLKVIRMTFQTVFGHPEEVAEDTNRAEGNFAEIRRAQMEAEKRRKENAARSSGRIGRAARRGGVNTGGSAERGEQQKTGPVSFDGLPKKEEQTNIQGSEKIESQGIPSKEPE